MNIKILSTQIYDDHEEKQVEEHKDSSLKILDKILLINYNNNEIIFDTENNIVEIRRNENNILVELNNEKEFDYETPYGKFVLKTIGEKIYVEENPFKMIIEYRIILNDTVSYKNIIEIVET